MTQQVWWVRGQRSCRSHWHFVLFIIIYFSDHETSKQISVIHWMKWEIAFAKLHLIFGIDFSHLKKGQSGKEKSVQCTTDLIFSFFFQLSKNISPIEYYVLSSDVHQYAWWRIKEQWIGQDSIRWFRLPGVLEFYFINMVIICIVINMVIICIVIKKIYFAWLLTNYSIWYVLGPAAKFPKISLFLSCFDL